MKRFLSFIFLFLVLFLPIKINALNDVDLYLFHSETCMHCQAEIEFLNEIKDDYPNLEIHLYEVSRNEDNANLLTKMKSTLNVQNSYVPFTMIGQRRYTGFTDNVKNQIIESVELYSEEDHRDIANEIMTGTYVSEDGEYQEQKDNFVIPILGKVSPKNVSLPLLAIVMGAIDGFNPCAMWVLLFLISMLFNMKNKKRMWALGLTFLTTSALVYLLFMVAWLNIAINLTSIVWIRLLIALVALIGGFINLKSWYKSLNKDSGCEVVDDKKRKKIFTKIRKITSEKSFILALLGVMVLAVSVNLIELACSAGLPLIFTQILALNDLSGLMYAIYIGIYILFFLIDDIVIFTVAMLTLNLTGISTKYSKYSHLIGGIIMVLIGLLMVFKPEWLMFNFS